MCFNQLDAVTLIFSSQDENDVDIKVLNSDNSDEVTLSLDCFFQLDKEGTSLPMQCVLCALEVNISPYSACSKDSRPNAIINLSTFRRKVTQRHRQIYRFHC